MNAMSKIVTRVALWVLVVLVVGAVTMNVLMAVAATR
jgi:hypothetical protein